MTHILLVEDDPAIATSLKVTFKREGWSLTWLDNISSVLPTLQEVSRNNTISLSAIILDVGLPDGNGLNLCKNIRNSTDIGCIRDLPIIFLTARNEEVDRILGLEIGADDYCPKPFSPRELVARLKAIWRRQESFNTSFSESQVQASQLFELDSGKWEYQSQNYKLLWEDNKLELSNTERNLLLFMLQNPRQVFSREQLLSAISNHPDHRLARTIDSHIKAIRKELSRLNPSKEVIHTHRGIGYGLCIP